MPGLVSDELGMSSRVGLSGTCQSVFIIEKAAVKLSLNEGWHGETIIKTCSVITKHVFYRLPRNILKS